MKKKNWLILIFMVIAAIALPITANAAKVKLNKKKVTLTVGNAVQLKVTGTKSKVKWSSSNKKVAAVSKKGKVKGKKAGKAVITARIGKKKLSCKITVKKKKTNEKGVKPQFSRKLITLNPYTHSSDSVRLTNISAAQMKNVKVWIEKTEDIFISHEMSIAQKVSYSVSGNTITIKAQNPGEFYLCASYGKKTGRCRIAIDGFDEGNDLIWNGKNYYMGDEDDGSCSQNKYGDILCEAYPETYGVFRKQYISKCKTQLAKILCIPKFYNDFGYRYEITNLGQMHYFIKNRVGQCQDYANETYNLCCVAGIPVEVVHSDKLNHRWDQVYMEGSWHPVDTVSNDLSFWALTKTQYSGEIPNDSTIFRGEYVTGNKRVSREGYKLMVSGKNVDFSKSIINFDPDDLVLHIFPKNDHKIELNDILDVNQIHYDLKSHFVNGQL